MSGTDEVDNSVVSYNDALAGIVTRLVKQGGTQQDFEQNILQLHPLLHLSDAVICDFRRIIQELLHQDFIDRNLIDRMKEYGKRFSGELSSLKAQGCPVDRLLLARHICDQHPEYTNAAILSEYIGHMIEYYIPQCEQYLRLKFPHFDQKIETLIEFGRLSSAASARFEKVIHEYVRTALSGCVGAETVTRFPPRSAGSEKPCQP